MRLNRKAAKRILSDTNNDCRFFSADGKKSSNLRDLWEVINSMDSGTFLIHTGKGENDFSSWIRGCLGDVRLADGIVGLDRKATLKKIGARITYVEKYLEGKL